MTNVFRIRYFLLLILFYSFSGKSQWRLDYGGGIGLSNYLGDIGGKEKTRRDFVADMKLAKTRWNLNGFVRYKMNTVWYVQGTLDYFRIEGDDKFSTNRARVARNLNFRNDMFELSVNNQFVIKEFTDIGRDYRFRVAFRPYVGVGLGLFYSNPKALYQGEWVKLKPLTTEGVAYKSIGLCIPASIGFHFTLKRKHRIGWELNWRTTFTDYLDDISKGWADPSTLSDLGAELSNRTDELDPSKFPLDYFNNFGYNPVENSTNKRGDPTHNDSYMTMSFNYSYIIRGKSNFYRSRYSNIFNKKRRKKNRKIRAKF